MRKKLIILGVMLLLIPGCKNDTTSGSSDNNSTNPVEVTPTNENTTEEVTENTTEEVTENNEEKSTQETTTSQNDTQEEEASITLGENEYIRVEDNTVHKYTFTYPDEETCVKKGDGEPYEILYPIRPYAVFDCEEIKDASGNILWGEFFYEEPSEEYIFYY